VNNFTDCAYSWWPHRAELVHLHHIGILLCQLGGCWCYQPEIPSNPQSSERQTLRTTVFMALTCMAVRTVMAAAHLCHVDCLSFLRRCVTICKSPNRCVAFILHNLSVNPVWMALTFLAQGPVLGKHLLSIYYRTNHHCGLLWHTRSSCVPNGSTPRPQIL
jgi:hypothetical protein